MEGKQKPKSEEVIDLTLLFHELHLTLFTIFILNQRKKPAHDTEIPWPSISLKKYNQFQKIIDEQKSIEIVVGN